VQTAQYLGWYIWESNMDLFSSSLHIPDEHRTSKRGKNWPEKEAGMMPTYTRDFPA
jgi:hypothetical protein